LDGAIPSTKGRSVTNYDKKGGLKDMIADYESAIRNAGGNPDTNTPLNGSIGQKN